MSLRSIFVGVRSHTWRPMRPGRVSAGSSWLIGTLVAPMKEIWSLRGFGRGTRRRELAGLLRDDVARVEQRVRPVREQAPEEGRVVDPVHHDEELVQRELAAAAQHPGNAPPPWLKIRPRPRRRRLGLALGEQALPPCARLENHVARRVQRAVRAVEERSPRCGRRCSCAPPERRAAHADGVDLVDEDDALAAPLARELLGLARQPADDDGVHAHEGLLETGARHQDEGAVEARGDRLREHRLFRFRARRGTAGRALAFRRLARTPLRTARG